MLQLRVDAHKTCLRVPEYQTATIHPTNDLPCPARDRLHLQELVHACISPTSPLHLAYISPTSRLHLAFISPTSRLHLAYISPTSRLHLAYISPTSRLHLAYLSPISPTCRNSSTHESSAVSPAATPEAVARATVRQCVSMAPPCCRARCVAIWRGGGSGYGEGEGWGEAPATDCWDSGGS